MELLHWRQNKRDSSVQSLPENISKQEKMGNGKYEEAFETASNWACMHKSENASGSGKQSYKLF